VLAIHRIVSLVTAYCFAIEDISPSQYIISFLRKKPCLMLALKDLISRLGPATIGLYENFQNLLPAKSNVVLLDTRAYENSAIIKIAKINFVWT